VDQLADGFEGRVGEAEVGEEGLERAAGGVVAERDTAHVERCRVGGDVGRLGDEQEVLSCAVLLRDFAAPGQGGSQLGRPVQATTVPGRTAPWAESRAAGVSEVGGAAS